MAGIGHNRGPGMEDGASWRRYCWTKARADLLPVLPIEVLRGRIRRAQELGLDYRTYAGVRAATGHDLIAFLFSSNALRLLAPAPSLPPDRRARLAAITGCDRIAFAQPPLTPQDVMTAATGVIDLTHIAPAAFAAFPEIRGLLRAAIGNHPADRVLLIGDAPWETDWCAAGRLAGHLPAGRYFGALQPLTA